ncbi:hypothetical protein BCR32DRAFT_283386, partial [Anaeromyces robustus]
MNFKYAVLAVLAALAVKAETSEECVSSKKCGSDVACIASCFNVPAPSVQQVMSAESCIKGCGDSVS